MEGRIDAVAVLSGSPTRVEILRQLRRGSSTERALRERVDCSRTTVHRNLETLCDHGWVECVDTEYAITTSGEIVLDRFLDVLAAVETTETLQPILSCLDREDLDLDITALRDATVTTPEPGDPLAMVNDHVQQLKRSQSPRLLTPLAGLHAHEVLHDRIVTDGLEASWIVPPNVAELYRTDPEYVELIDDMCATGRADVYVYDGEIPYYLGSAEESRCSRRA